MKDLTYLSTIVMFACASQFCELPAFGLAFTSAALTVCGMWLIDLAWRARR